ncbi:futalosine hydrolase [Desulfococcus sp.]|uniref:futalosine hydrolase n=1 Tax=Desulfococcus sp. TaxID=2025834 RepID=UPI003593CE91
MAAAPYVLIIGAVDGELSGLRRRMNAWATEEIGRRPIQRGRLCGVPVRLMVTGPGSANTVQALTAVLEQAPPRLILQTGCAGAFRESGLSVGDVGVASEEIDAHLGIEPQAPEDPPTALPFPVMTALGAAVTGRYPLSRRWSEAAVDALSRDPARRGAGGAWEDADSTAGLPPGTTGVRVVCGPFLTVSTITATDLGAERRYRQFRACMEAMEGAGAAHVACHYDVPLLEVRAASNLVGRRDRGAWDLDLAFRRATWAVLAILDHCRELFQESLQ